MQFLFLWIKNVKNIADWLDLKGPSAWSDRVTLWNLFCILNMSGCNVKRALFCFYLGRRYCSSFKNKVCTTGKNIGIVLALLARISVQEMAFSDYWFQEIKVTKIRCYEVAHRSILGQQLITWSGKFETKHLFSS